VNDCSQIIDYQRTILSSKVDPIVKTETIGV